MDLVELAEAWQKEIAQYPPTGQIGESTWHEVKFKMKHGHVITPVFNGKWVNNVFDLDAIVSVEKVN